MPTNITSFPIPGTLPNETIISDTFDAVAGIKNGRWVQVPGETFPVWGAAEAAASAASAASDADRAEAAADRIDLGAFDADVAATATARDEAEAAAGAAATSASDASASASSASGSAVAAAASEAAAELANDAAQLSRGIFASTTAGLSKGVINTASLVGGSGGTDGTFALAFSGGGGAGAAGTFVVAGGSVVQVNISNPGTGYTSAPTISFAASSGLTGASATAVIDYRNPVGTYFSVPGTTPDSLILYSVGAGPAATEVTRYPSVTGLAGVAARNVGFIAAPGLGDALAHLVAIELYRSVNGVAVTLPALLCVREIARDGLNRFRLRLASYDGVSAYTSVATENNGGGASISVTGYTGYVWMTILADGTSLGPADNTVIGRALVDFGTGSTFGTYAGTIAYSAGGVTPSLAQSGPRFENDVNEIITKAAAVNVGAKIPFSDDMIGSQLLRKLVRSAWVYGGDPTHEYAISNFEARQTGGLTRVLVQLYDVTAAVEVARYVHNIMSLETYATLVAAVGNYLQLTDNAIAVKGRVTAFLEIDWTATAALFSNIGAATMAGAGLHPSRILSDDMIGDYLDTGHAHVSVKVGAAETLTTLRAAVEDIYSPSTGSTAINGSPICEYAHPNNRVRLNLVDNADYQATGLYMPWYTEICGVGMDATRIIRENTDPDPVLEVRGSFKARDLTIYSETASEYCFHFDNFNRHVIGGDAQNVRARQSYERVKLIGAAGHNGWLFGCGVSSGDDVRFTGCVAEHVDSTATAPAWGFHNTGPTISDPTIAASAKPASVLMRGCASPDQLGVLLSTLEASAPCLLTLESCDFRMIEISTSSGTEVLSDLAAERNAWQIAGRYDGPFLRSDPVGENVLKTTAGQTPSGSAAALIFGTVDDLGRGEKWINGTTGAQYSLGARLGDCSSVSKALTIGGQTHTFTTNLTATSNATILAAINASITSYPVSVVDVQLEWVPDAAPKRRVRNSTGSTIPKGRFVRFSGAATVALCAAGERPDGWTHREILNGADGYVMLTRQMATAYIGGATSSTGEWGITTAGTLDYVASVKLGRTIGGLVTVWG